jgi:NAD(P)-dependent dehydrogenase (short-subunit alcohol dehydrogenase family)
MEEALSTQNFRLDNKVALITGASRGIGQAIAETFADAGAKVILSSRKQEGLEMVAEKLRASGHDALPLAAHTGDIDAITELVKQGVAAYGGIDILVNNAGTNPHYGPILTADDGQWAKILDTNLIGYFRVTKACVPFMQEKGGGKIINMASIAGKSPQPGMGVYCVSKAGVLMLTKVLAAELAKDNIQVNAIAPGFIKTRFSQAIWENPKFLEMTMQRIPQNRLATPEELTGAALLLASDASAFITGSTFVLDGGQLVNSGNI